MIGTVDCNVQAKYPSMPLDPMQAYVGSPSSIRVRNVPKRIGDWCIRSVQFVAVYPDASIKTAECKLVGCVWVGTIEGTQTSGKVQNGYSIFASGTDENGNEVSGYCLGKGDVEILEADGTIDPGTTSYYMHLLSAESASPKAGDVWLSGEAINIVDIDGTTKTFEQPELSGYATKDELSAKQDKITANGVLSGDGQGNITSADMNGIISSTVLAKEDVWTVAGFPNWTYQYRVVEQYGYYAGEEGWIYTVNVTSCDNPEWRYTTEASEPTVSPTKLETFTMILQDWGEYEYPIDTYTVTASVVGRDRNELGLVTYDDIIAGILSGDGQGNITSADMSMYVKQNDSPVFNSLTALGSNYIYGYATTAQLENGLSGKADKYPFTTILDASDTINLRDAEVQKYTAAAQQDLSVYPPSGTSTTARDLVFVIDCAANSVSVNVKWANNIHPHTDASTDMSVLSNAVNVYYLNEYASGQFVIAGWQETAGGNA